MTPLISVEDCLALEAEQGLRGKHSCWGLQLQGKDWTHRPCTRSCTLGAQGFSDISEKAEQDKITHSHPPPSRHFRKGVISSHRVSQPILAISDDTVGNVQSGYGFHLYLSLPNIQLLCSTSHKHNVRILQDLVTLVLPKPNGPAEKE